MAEQSEIAQFIRDYIPSVWALELLLLLHADPHRHWTNGELVRELRASTKVIAENLCRFERHGLALNNENGWCFAPANPMLAAMTARLAQLYKERPMSTISLIVRPDVLQSLADAFRIKRDDT